VGRQRTLGPFAVEDVLGERLGLLDELELGHLLSRLLPQQDLGDYRGDVESIHPLAPDAASLRGSSLFRPEAATRDGAVRPALKGRSFGRPRSGG
jgi:hypothetical protein